MNIRKSTFFIAALILLAQLVAPLSAHAATSDFTPNPQTAYAKIFITECSGQQWFINEVERLLNQEQKTLDTVTSSSDFTNIRSLGLKDESISGSIPSAIGELTNLEYLFLSGNRLSGTMPSELYTLKKLKYVDLSGNGYTGSIPSEFGGMTALTSLELKNNKYTGTIPSTILTNTKITVLNLLGNQLTGGIPSDISKMAALQYLNLSNNTFGGTIPDLSALTSLKALSLWSCGLTGTMPSTIYSLTNLQILDLASNSFTGEISADIPKLIALQDLSLASNMLRGTIPDVFGASTIATVHLENNYLRGTVPATLKARNDAGAKIYLSNNYLTGTDLKGMTNNAKNFTDSATTEQYQLQATKSLVQISKTGTVNVYALLNNSSLTTSGTAKSLLNPGEYTLTYDTTKLEVTVNTTDISVKALTDIKTADNIKITIAITDNAGSSYSKTEMQLTTDTVASAGGGGASSTPTTVNQYINGFPDGTFEPEMNVTREQIAKMVISALEINSGSYKTSSYTDASAGRWSLSYIEKATELGYMKGYGSGIFKPENSMTRAELATCLVRIEEKQGTIANDTTTSFSDVKADAWYSSYVRKANAMSLVKGYSDGSFGPDKTVTRAEAVTMINRLLGRDPTADTSLKTLTNPFSDVASDHWAYLQILEAGVTHQYSAN